MPLHGTTLYAKWVTVEEAGQLGNILLLDEGTYVEITGTVFALLSNGYEGFYLFDATGSLFIRYDQSGLILGDRVALTGILTFWNGVPQLVHVANVVEQSAGNSLPTYPFLDLSAIGNADPVTGRFSTTVSTTGVLIKESSFYYLVEIDSGKKFPLSERFTNTGTMDPLLGKCVDAQLLFYAYEEDLWMLGPTNIIESTRSAEQIRAEIQAWLIREYAHVYHPGDLFDLPTVDPFNWSAISYVRPSVIAEDTKLFLSTETETILAISVTISLGGGTTTFNLTVTHAPLAIRTIAEFLAGTPGTYYHLHGLVIMTTPYRSVCLIQDATGFLFVEYNPKWVTGDQISATFIRNTDERMVVVEEEAVLDFSVISENNALDVFAVHRTVSELNSLSLDNPAIYGQYVEVRGILDYISPIDMPYHGNFVLDSGSSALLRVEGITHEGFEILYDFVNLEVIMHGYLGLDEDGFLTLFYTGTRNDCVIPDYTDEERIQMISTLFARKYANSSFHSFDAFVLFPYHPVLGGTIVWNFTNGSEDFYDEAKGQFRFTDVTVPITIDVTVSKGMQSLTYQFTTTLLPPEYMSISAIKNSDNFTTAYAKGLVIYRTPYLLFLQDATGILLVEAYDLPCYQGDYVVIWGVKTTMDSNEQTSAAELYDNDNYGEVTVIAILSRDNPITVNENNLTLYTLSDLDPLDPDHHTQYVTLSGRLEASVDHIGYYSLSAGNHQVLIQAIDDYTGYKMDRMLGSASGSMEITLSAYLYDYDADLEHWVLKFTGMEQETSIPEYTDSQKADIIQEWILDSYQSLPSDQSGFYFATSYPIFGGSVSYVLSGENASLIDQTLHTIALVSSAKTINTVATISIGTVTREVPFTITLQCPETETGVDITAIANLLTTEQGSRHTIQGVVIAIGCAVDGSYYYLVEDTTGVLFVQAPTGVWYYDYSMIGRTLTAAGLYQTIDGRPEMDAETAVLSSSEVILPITFASVSMAELASIDLYNTTRFGEAVQVSGVIELDQFGQVYLVNGQTKLLISFINNYYLYTDDLWNYEGLPVTINGFFVGNGLSASADVLSLLFTDAEYGNSYNIAIAETDETALATWVLNYLEKNLNIKNAQPLDYYYLPTLPSGHPLMNTAQISYSLLGVNPSAEIRSNTELLFGIPATDETIQIQVEVTVGPITLNRIFSTLLSGYPLCTLNDLFDPSVDFDEILLYASVLHTEWGYTYFLIGDQIYYLENREISSRVSMDDEVYLLGKKSIIDGIPDYSYEIRGLKNYQYGTKALEPRILTLSALYATDLCSDPLSQDYLGLSGTLGYDHYLEMFYLADGENRVYIRETLKEEMEAFSTLSITPSGSYFTKADLHRYVGDVINMYVLFPNKVVRGNVYLVDFRGFANEITIPQYTVQEHVTMSKNKTELLLQGLTFSSFDALYSVFPRYDDFIHETEFEYLATNSDDDHYFDFQNGWVKIVTAPVDVSITCVVARWEYVGEVNTEFFETFTFTVHLEPLEESAIREVLWGEDAKPYLIQGVIQKLYTGDDWWLLVKDESGLIYIDARGYTDWLGINLAVGDEIRLLGERTTYENEGYVPMLENVVDIDVISHGNAIVRTAIPMTTEDILNLDYLNPDVYNQYISMTGTVVFSGNVWYPSYDLHDATFITDDYDTQLWNGDYPVLDEEMDPYRGVYVRVEGYLYGFEYIFDYYDWQMFYTSVTTVPAS